VYLIPTDRTHGNKYAFYHSQYIFLNVWRCRENSVTKKIICWCRGILTCLLHGAESFL